MFGYITANSVLWKTCCKPNLSQNCNWWLKEWAMTVCSPRHMVQHYGHPLSFFLCKEEDYCDLIVCPWHMSHCRCCRWAKDSPCHTYTVPLAQHSVQTEKCDRHCSSPMWNMICPSSPAVATQKGHWHHMDTTFMVLECPMISPAISSLVQCLLLHCMAHGLSFACYRTQWMLWCTRDISRPWPSHASSLSGYYSTSADVQGNGEFCPTDPIPTLSLISMHSEGVGFHGWGLDAEGWVQSHW